MTYALVSDIPVSWQTYKKIAASALDNIPTGLIIHAAGPTDEGVRIIDVWETEQAYKSFQEQQLQPLLAPRVDPTAVSVFRDLHVQHLVAPSKTDPRA